MEVLPSKLDGTNYMRWSFHLKNSIKGKGLLGYLDGSNHQPADNTATKTLAAWNQNNAKVVSWILNSVDPTVSLSLRLIPRPLLCGLI